MLELAGYTGLAPIHSGQRSLVLRGRRASDGLPVIVKTPAARYPNATDLDRLRHEFALARLIESGPAKEHVVRCSALVPMGTSLALVIEDFGGRSLREQLAIGGLAVPAFLEIALRLCLCVRALHDSKILHLDINPAHILVNPQNGEVRLCDFSASVNGSNAPIPGMFKGSPAYASPEQTLRTGRAVDDRSDLYSLGVTLFETLCGRLPYGGADVLETFHRHLSASPPSVRATRPDVPEPVDRVLLKLFSKDPDERYRSARGLSVDLARCRDELRERGSIAMFELGRDDTSTQLYFSERIYGRDRELGELRAQFKLAQAGEAPFVLVSGQPGVGKSSLVSQLRDHVRRQGGQFYSGKFELMQSRVPYTAFASAFRFFLQHVLARPASQLRSWRERLLAALGPNGRLLIRLVPELERVIGPQLEPAELDPEQSKARFRHLLLNLVDAMAAPDSPLVIFLDDLQWADQASLDLLEQLVSTPRFRHLMVIGAYRDSTLDAEAAWSALKSRAAAHRPFCEIRLAPLEAAEVQQLVAQVLQGSVVHTQALAQVVARKTRGNPFFVSQFLRTLQNEQMLWFDSAQRQWAWSLEAIEAHPGTDNVIDLVVGRIDRLPAATRELLQHAACIGGDFTSELLGDLAGRSTTDVEQALSPAVAADLLARPSFADLGTEQETLADRFRFAHDQMQQAAYASIPEDKRGGLHLAIGRSLLRVWSEDQRRDRAFQLVEHFQRGLPLLQSSAERRMVAELCLVAGRRAKAANANSAAAGHLSIGLDLLGADGGWAHDYELALALHTEFAQCSYVIGDVAGMARSCAQIVASGRTLLEKIPAYQLELLAYAAQNEMAKAIDVAREVLGMLGVRLPVRVSKLAVAVTVARTSLRMRREVPDRLLARPTMREPRILCAMRILAHVAAPAYLSSPLLFPLVMAKMLALTLEYGVSEWTADALVGWGAIQIAGFGAIQQGNALGSCAPRLVERLLVAQHRGRIQTTYNLLIRHWIEPLHATIQPLADAVQSALEHGDLPYASAAGVTSTFYMLMAGRPLADVESSAQALRKLLTPLGQERFTRDAGRVLQLVHCLQGRGPHPKLLRGEFFDDVASQCASEAVGDRAAIASLNYERAYLLYVYDDLLGALDRCETATRFIDSLVATVYAPALDFLSALVRTRLVAQGRLQGQAPSELKRARASLRRLVRWAESAPANQAHRVDLVRAELAALKGDTAKATRLYESAITLAERSGYVHELAMALECAGHFHARVGHARLADATLHAARGAWLSWGAPGIAARVDSGPRFQHLLRHHEPRSLLAKTGPGALTPQAFEQMDIGSVIKACQAIVSEIRLPRLVRRLLKLAMENTGAQRGFLFLSQESGLKLTASADVDDGETPLKTEVPGVNFQAEQLVPYAIANYVARLMEPLVDDDMSASALFGDDPYVTTEHPLSVLCVPLVSQGVLNGVLYLENNRLRGAFSAERVQVLTLLSALSSISVENARLYEDVERAHALEVEISRAQSRFVPAEFLRNLERASIVDVELGDNIRKDMTVLFSDVRDFTRIVESMSPELHIGFINRYLGYMEPAILNAGGFVDSYLGDGIMALFEGDADRALDAVVSMSKELARYNQTHDGEHIRMGVGISTGPLTLGTIGGTNRIKCSVIGDPVNLASRLESLTKSFSCFALISESTRNSLRNPLRFDLRMVDRVRVKGKLQPITLFEILNAEPPAIAEAKYKDRARFEEALMLYSAGNFRDAGRLFEECLVGCANDGAAMQLHARCLEFRAHAPANWDGINVLTEK